MKVKLARHFVMSLYAFFFIFPCTAHAYLDPGTGSMLLQFLAAGLLGLGVFWRKITGIIFRIFSRFISKS